MRIGILGTGGVARTLAGALDDRGDEVELGSRDPDAALARDDVNQQTGTSLAGWHEGHPAVQIRAFADAAAHGELVLNATSGDGSMSAVDAAGAALHGKVLVDISNPIAWGEQGVSLFVSNTDSLAEQLQRAHPQVRVVKALNTVTAAVMVDPGQLAGGDHTLPICGDDEDAKTLVAAWLRDAFGWRDVLDIGDLTAARAQEASLLMWLRLSAATGSPIVNTKVVR
jgi:predicted dinucleotide-binding enzyme